jgi:hypothetical protein
VQVSRGLSFQAVVLFLRFLSTFPNATKIIHQGVDFRIISLITFLIPTARTLAFQ